MSETVYLLMEELHYEFTNVIGVVATEKLGREWLESKRREIRAPRAPRDSPPIQEEEERIDFTWGQTTYAVVRFRVARLLADIQ